MAGPKRSLNIVLLTREYPPYVYGGAGVHAEYLSRELARLDDGLHRVQVFCFGDQRVDRGNLTVRGVEAGFEPPSQDPRHSGFLKAMAHDVVMAGSVENADVIHCHTWYSHLAGMMLRQLLGAPLVLSTHSLEPHRPWKEEQLGTAYFATSWLEHTAYRAADGVIAVSQAMRTDVAKLYGVPDERIRVIHNGIDTDEYSHKPDPGVLAKYGVDPERPIVLFVGRVTRQKGIIHLVRAISEVRSEVQFVLCAGAPDTEEIGKEMSERVRRARSATANPVIWISEMLPKSEVIALYSHASVFVCPSVYEPFGIINLEAMACGTPVVASKVGGIPEIVIPGETGYLVPFEPVSEIVTEPKKPEEFARDLAGYIDRLVSSPDDLRRMSRAARARVEEHFSWHGIARHTADFYRALIESFKR